MRQALGVLAALLGALALPGIFGTVAAQTPAYFEVTVLEDPVDYAANRALDLVGVHAWTSYEVELTKFRPIGPALNVRIQPIQIEDASSVSPRYHLHFKVGPVAHDYYAQIGAAGGRIGVTDNNTIARANATSVILTLPFNATDLSIGSVLTEFYVVSSTLTSAGRVFHDLVPKDNRHQPEGSSVGVPSNAGTHVLLPPFPFVTATPKTPLQAMSAEGGAVEYEFTVAAHPQVRQEVVLFLFDAPEGWTATPSHASDGYGYLGALGDTPVDFAVQVNASRTPIPPGVEAVVQMRMFSLTGAYDEWTLLTRVVGARIESPDYQFDLLPVDGPLAGRFETLRIELTDSHDAPLAGIRLAVDLLHAGVLVSSLENRTETDGIATFVAQFPQPGHWALEAYLPSLSPSPSHSFDVLVTPEPRASSLPWIGVLAAVVIVSSLRRRLQ